VLAAELLAARWKLSNARKDRLIAAAGAARDLALFADVRLARRQLYRLGAEAFHDALLLALVAQPRQDWRTVLDGVRDLRVPAFPLSGQDVLARGVRMGPLIGLVLREVEAWWVENDFPADEALLWARLDEAVSRVGP